MGGQVELEDLGTGVSSACVAPTAIQALRSVLNAFSVVNRKNMFVYQERATKAVYYLRYVSLGRCVKA